MSKLLVTAFTVLAVSGCATASTAPDPVDGEPPPSSRREPCAASEAWSTKLPPRPAKDCNDAWPDGDPKGDPPSIDCVGIPTPPTGFVPDFPDGPSDLVGIPTPPTGFTEGEDRVDLR